MTDDFMQAVIEGKPFVQQYPIDSPSPMITKEINARELWHKIIHNAWASAEPGVIFWDTVIKESVPDCYADLGFKTVSTNPCGEIPLCPYDRCRLLAINLYGYVDDPFTPKASFNFPKFKKHVRYAQRMMDDIVDLEIEKVDRIISKISADPELSETKRTELNLWRKIRAKSEEGRRTGVGITAEGDMLAALNIRYGSDEAIDFSEKVHQTLAVEACRSSVQMAEERGSFPIYDPEREMNNPFIARLRDADKELYDEMVKHGRRNIAMLTVAPTGSVSIMTQTTSGIEPAFEVAYKRRRKVNPNDKNVRVSFVDEIGDSWEEYNVFHHKFITWLEQQGLDAERISTSANDEELQQLIERSPYFKSTANDVDWVNKVKMQGRIQKWVDHSISVTVNVPSDITEDMVANIYQTGWQSGCKGVTVYRDGSRSGVLITDDKKNTKVADFTETRAPKRPERLEADVIKFYNDDQKWIAVVGLYNGRPYEIFTGKADDSFEILQKVDHGWVIRAKNGGGKTRYDFQYADKDGYNTTIEGLSRTFNEEFWNYAKLISGVLRHGMPIQYVVDVVTNLHLHDETLNTWKNGVVRTLKRYIPDGTTAEHAECEKCGQESLVYQEGCLTCKSCGHSKCG
jgi:ribonucleoside-diphosphate reductase alpha chain